MTVGVDQPAVVEKGQIGYTLWAHNLAYASSFLNVLFGLVAYLWQDTIAQRPQAGEFLFALPYVGVYAMVLGVLVYAFEYFFGLQQVWWLWMESAPMTRPRVSSGSAASDCVSGSRGFLYLKIAVWTSSSRRDSPVDTHWPIIESPPTNSRCPCSTICRPGQPVPARNTA